MRRLRAGSLAFVAMAAGLAGAAARADGPVDMIAGAVDVAAPARSVPALTDVVAVYNKANALSADVQTRASAAAGSVGAAWALGRSASVPLDSIRRGGDYVQLAPYGYHYPMGVTVLPLNAVGPLMGRDVASVLARGFVVMGALTASLRGAQVGDILDIEADNGNVVTLGVGMIAADEVVGGTEILMSPSTADVLGITVVGRIVIWGIASRAALDQAFAAVGLDVRADVRIRRSWDPVDPDSTLGLAETKLRLGEFAYRVRSDGINVDTNPEWWTVNLPADREVLFDGIPIRARCHNATRADLAAALAEVYQAGLAGEIEVGNANTYGGCYGPRFNRISGELGFLSRHSWGQALDTNTVSNAQGTTPKMNCDVVRIFRKHNFAWGGNFLTPDGMHFEWVGTRRDQFQYPSRYCPNPPVAAGTESGPAFGPATNGDDRLGRATMFASDGFESG